MKKEVEVENKLKGPVVGGKVKGKVGQEQLYDLLTSQELSWKSIIYDLIRTEQLDPWNINLVLLTRRYLEKIQELREEAFFVSSKLLLAAALLLRIKSEFLHNNILSIDEILFSKKKKTDELVKGAIRIDFLKELQEEDLELFPRTPLPRTRKITLKELMKALERAMNTEHRRIKREINFKRLRTDVDFVLPKQRVSWKEKIKGIYNKIKDFFSRNKEQKLTFTYLAGAGSGRTERISTFVPLLHLDNQEKITLHQEKPFDEIEITMK